MFCKEKIIIQRRWKDCISTERLQNFSYEKNVTLMTDSYAGEVIKPHLSDDSVVQGVITKYFTEY